MEMIDPAPVRLSDEFELFIERVRVTAGLDSAPDTEVLARATMRHLGRQMTDDIATALTAEMPSELARELTADARSTAGDFDKEKLVEQVAGHLHASDVDTVERQVHAVLATVRSWAGDGHVEDALARVPSSMAILFA